MNMHEPIPHASSMLRATNAAVNELAAMESSGADPNETALMRKAVQTQLDQLNTTIHSITVNPFYKGDSRAGALESEYNALSDKWNAAKQ